MTKGPISRPSGPGSSRPATRRWRRIRSGLVAFACALVTAACTTTGAPSDAATAFVGVNVVPMTDAQTWLPDQVVVVRNGRIAAIGPRDSTPIPADATRIDGAGGYLVPGLADMHVHLEHFEDPAVLQLFVASGVTTVRNMDGRPYILDWRRRVAAGELTGPTIVTAGPIIDGSPPLRDDNLAVADAASAAVAVEAQAASGYDFIKLYTNLSPEAFGGAVATARRLNLPVSGHIPRRLGVADVLGVYRSIEHLTDYDEAIDARPPPERRWRWSNLYLAIPADPARMAELADTLARQGTWTVPTLIQAERGLARPETVERWRSLPEMALLPEAMVAEWTALAARFAGRMDEGDWQLAARGHANRVALVRALHAAGAPLLAGSDTPNSFVVPGAALHDELALLVEAGLSPGEALLAATSDAARYFDQARDWGTIEPGRRADLILVDANPLEDVGALRHRAGVMARGRWFGRAELDRMARALVEAR